MSSEERLRHAPFLTDLDALTILKQFLRTSKHLALGARSRRGRSPEKCRWAQVSLLRMETCAYRSELAVSFLAPDPN
jgi:hypothetical protein